MATQPSCPCLYSIHGPNYVDYRSYPIAVVETRWCKSVIKVEWKSMNDLSPKLRESSTKLFLPVLQFPEGQIYVGTEPIINRLLKCTPYRLTPSDENEQDLERWARQTLMHTAANRDLQTANSWATAWDRWKWRMDELEQKMANRHHGSLTVFDTVLMPQTIEFLRQFWCKNSIGRSSKKNAIFHDWLTPYPRFRLYVQQFVSEEWSGHRMYKKTKYHGCYATGDGRMDHGKGEAKILRELMAAAQSKKGSQKFAAFEKECEKEQKSGVNEGGKENAGDGEGEGIDSKYTAMFDELTSDESETAEPATETITETAQETTQNSNESQPETVGNTNENISEAKESSETEQNVTEPKSDTVKTEEDTPTTDEIKAGPNDTNEETDTEQKKTETDAQNGNDDTFESTENQIETDTNEVKTEEMKYEANRAEVSDESECKEVKGKMAAIVSDDLSEKVGGKGVGENDSGVDRETKFGTNQTEGTEESKAENIDEKVSVTAETIKESNVRIESEKKESNEASALTEEDTEVNDFKATNEEADTVAIAQNRSDDTENQIESEEIKEEGREQDTIGNDEAGAVKQTGGAEKQKKAQPFSDPFADITKDYGQQQQNMMGGMGGGNPCNNQNNMGQQRASGYGQHMGMGMGGGGATAAKRDLSDTNKSILQGIVCSMWALSIGWIVYSTRTKK